MAITDKLTKVGNPGTVTSLQSPGKAIAAGSINIGSATNWPTSPNKVYFAMRQVDANGALVPGTYTEWAGTIAGTTLSNLQLQYGTDQVYPAGASTQVYIPIISARENSIIDHLLTEHNQDGTHNNTLLAMLAGAQTFTGVKTFSTAPVLPNNAIPAAALSTSAITLGYEAISTLFGSSAASAAQITGTRVVAGGSGNLGVTVTIPAGGRKVRITVHCGSVFNSTANVTSVVGIWDGTPGSGTLLNQGVYTSATVNAQSPVTVTAIVTPAAGSKTYNASLHAPGGGAANFAAGANANGYILVEAI